jgi:lipopolysaccharide biosynthesis glycosyltransferase
MSRNVIVVQNVFDDLNKTRQSIESIRQSAHRWKSHFFEMTEFEFSESSAPITWNLWCINDTFKDFDKVAILDPDVVVNSKSPNIFDELTSDYDFCAVLDGNPNGRFSNSGHLKDSIVKRVACEPFSLNLFHKHIRNFSYEKYWNNYFNGGVILFNPKKLYPIFLEMKDIIFSNKEIYKYLNTYDTDYKFHSPQNFFNAFISSSNLRIKNMDNYWNWVMPDIIDEFNSNFYLGPMKPWIYHFTGTDGSKDELLNYERWK